jgi:hypothetical protein
VTTLIQLKEILGFGHYAAFLSLYYLKVERNIMAIIILLEDTLKELLTVAQVALQCGQL